MSKEKELIIKWLNDNGHSKVTSKIIPTDKHGEFRPVVDVIHRLLEQSEPKQYTEADLVSFGNALLADRAKGNYLLSKKDVTHADLENWKKRNELDDKLKELEGACKSVNCATHSEVSSYYCKDCISKMQPKPKTSESDTQQNDMKGFLKDDALAFSWIVMSRTHKRSSVYEKAARFWTTYADVGQKGSRPPVTNPIKQSNQVNAELCSCPDYEGTAEDGMCYECRKELRDDYPKNQALENAKG